MTLQKPWTISRYQAWFKCPLQYALENCPELVIDRFKGWTIKKLPAREVGPAMQRGTDIHDLFEVFLQTGMVPDEMHPYFEIFENWFIELAHLRECIASADAGGSEVLWEFDRDWYETTKRATVWHRQKLDSWFVTGCDAEVIDYKSGRVYPYHGEQLEVYAVGTLAKFDGVESVRTALWYVDQPKSSDNPLIKEYTRDKDGHRLARRWEKRARQIEEDTEFKAKPDKWTCRFCAFSAKKGGPCKKGI